MCAQRAEVGYDSPGLADATPRRIMWVTDAGGRTSVALHNALPEIAVGAEAVFLTGGHHLPLARLDLPLQL